LESALDALGELQQVFIVQLSEQSDMLPQPESAQGELESFST